MNRIQSVDVIKFFAILSVIAIHTGPFRNMGDSQFYMGLAIFINQLNRFAVPFFFVVSGYFWSKKISKEQNDSQNFFKYTNTLALKFLFVFTSWSLIYLIPYEALSSTDSSLPILKFSSEKWNTLYNSPIEAVFQGTREHLWFLIALIFSLYISAIFIKCRKAVLLIPLSICLYCFGIFAKSYSQTELGIDVNFNTRNGPFFGTLFFVTGYYLSNLKPSPKWFKWGVISFVFGLAIHMLEITMLWNRYQVRPTHDFVFGTYFLGLGPALIALSKKQFTALGSLGKLGRFTLGIYASHYLFVDILKPVDKMITNPLWEIGFILMVLCYSLGMTWLMLKIPFFKRIVS